VIAPRPQLSGGEQARVLIARYLGQEAPLLHRGEPDRGLTRPSKLPQCRSFTKQQHRGVIVFGFGFTI